MGRRTLLIVTGEASGDLHGAELAQALRVREPDLRILGMGGERMRQAGVELVFDIRSLGVMGIVEVFRKWRAILQAFAAVKNILRREAVDLVVLIDSPEFNLRVARTAKRLGLPTVYYIGPKIWAWRSGRMKTILKCIDRMLVIFPFEKALYQAAGVPCEFVGHPLMDEIPQSLDRSDLRKRFGIPADAVVVALLPGSRQMELDRLLDVMVEALVKIRRQMPAVEAILPVAPSLSMSELSQRLSDRSVDIRLVSGQTPEVLACADSAIVASGTATLEAAVVGTPLIIVYKVAWITYLVAYLMVKTRMAGLVNIIAGRKVVPELLQSDASPEKIADAVLDQLRNQSLAQEVRRELADIRRKLGRPGAAERAAAHIMGQLSDPTRTVAV